MKTFKIICISEYSSGREVVTMPLSQLSQDYISGLLSTEEIDQDTLEVIEIEPDYSASIFEVPWQAWALKEQNKNYNPYHHTSHYLSKVGEELCLGDYI